MQEKIRTKGVANHSSIGMPKVIFEVLTHRGDLFIERQQTKVASCFSTSHIKPSIHQRPAQS
jgi:hypothetical protein